MQIQSQQQVAAQDGDDDRVQQDRRQFFGHLVKGGARLAAGLLLLPGTRHKDEVAADTDAPGVESSVSREAPSLVEGAVTVAYCPALVGLVTTFTYDHSGRLMSKRSEGGDGSSRTPS